MTDNREPAPRLGSMLPPSIEEMQEGQEGRWESTIVDVTCMRLGISTAKRAEMREWNWRRAGVSRDLTFDAFHEVIPDFPVFFGCEMFRNLGKHVPVSRLFMQFAKTPMFKAYLKIREHGVPDSATMHRIGLVFRWPNLMRTGEKPTALVLHNRPINLEIGGTRLTFTINQSNNPSVESNEIIHLHMTPLPILLAEVLADKAWRNE